MATTLTPKTSQTLNKAADECYEKAGDDWEAAKDLLYERIIKDMELLGELAVWGSSQLILQAASRIRGRIMSKMAHTKPPKDAALEGMFTTKIETWWDSPLQGGLRLGKALKIDVINEYEKYRPATRTKLARAWFYKYIAEATEHDIPMEEQLSLEQVTNLWLKAEAKAKKTI